MSAAWDMENGAALVPAETLARRRRRTRTVNASRLAKYAIETGRAEADAALAELDAAAIERPRTRHECLQGDNAERPCPFVSCEYHLAVDVDERNGSIKLNFPDLEVWEMPETCALDVADRGAHELAEIGALMSVTRERIRLIEAQAIDRLAKLRALDALRPEREVTRGIEPEREERVALDRMVRRAREAERRVAAEVRALETARAATREWR